MDGEYFPGECLCGSIDFERIVVQRKPNTPITTDFVACLQCRAMYFVPLPPIVVTPREGPTGGGAIGGPDGGRSCNSPPQRRENPPLKGEAAPIGLPLASASLSELSSRLAAPDDQADGGQTHDH